MLDPERRIIADSKPGQRQRRAYVAPALDPLSLARDAALASVLAYGGLRPAEALALRWSDVRERTLNIERACDLAGDNWRRRRWVPALKRAELPAARPYDLCHSFASLLLAEGRSVHYVAAQLGHGAEQTLRTYGHVIAEYEHRLDVDAEIRAAKSARVAPEWPTPDDDVAEPSLGKQKPARARGFREG